MYCCGWRHERKNKTKQKNTHLSYFLTGVYIYVSLYLVEYMLYIDRFHHFVLLLDDPFIWGYIFQSLYNHYTAILLGLGAVLQYIIVI